ncbi:hypothetical protein [Taibaiella chishuiensis]|uniref:hypothetical protein n=1 Tax=Taibaiella chishuiensis TaxID=1434707 RepID=UPI0015E67FE3|nr:hypothetical protein [Taibaiella chishuiensis]
MATRSSVPGFLNPGWMIYPAGAFDNGWTLRSTGRKFLEHIFDFAGFRSHFFYNSCDTFNLIRHRDFKSKLTISKGRKVELFPGFEKPSKNEQCI